MCLFFLNIVVGGYGIPLFRGTVEENNFLYLSLISLFARRRGNGEGATQLCVTAAGSYTQPDKEEGKDAGGADFVPLPLTSKVSFTGVLIRY